MDTDELVELPCPEPGCEYRAVGKAKPGSGAATWKLGNHRRQAHGYRNPNARRKAPKRTASASPDTPTAVSLARDMATDLDTGTDKPPTTDEWERALGRGLFTLSISAASWLVETDPTIPDDTTREAVADYLSLKPAAARETMRPVAKLVGRSKVNAKIGRTVVDNVDVVSSVSELGLLFLRYRRYFRQRAAMEARMLGAPTLMGTGGAQWQPPPPTIDPMADAMAAVPVGVGSVIDPGTQQGYVVDAAMVQQMRARQQGNGHA